MHRRTDPSCSRQALKIPIFLEELHWHFTKAFIFTNSYLHYFCCFLLCILGSLHPNGHYESFFCPPYIPSAPTGFAHHLQHHCQETSLCCRQPGEQSEAQTAQPRGKTEQIQVTYAAGKLRGQRKQVKLLQRREWFVLPVHKQ